jgi:chromosome segregation protein
MFLKTIKIAGFKSFADHTRLEIEPGVTTIVGPNGSGKSNIVDAVTWVLGTQSTRSLRTQTMEDVIFAGTATRPALGRAEVTLVFDNADRLLPLDLSEVSITRRLYRDGSSDYEVNGAECRLLDIQELLSDSGVGRHQHIIVGQGQIAQILNAKPDDHRAVIEEAAGILKHRLRKDRSIRRLERTDGDVLRLHDILAELKRQIRPLKRQAKDALRHGSVRDQLVAMHCWVGAESLRAIDARTRQLETDSAIRQEKVARAASELTNIQEELGPMEGTVASLTSALEVDTEAAARLETMAERARGVVQVAKERYRSLNARLEGADDRKNDLGNELEELTVRLATVGTEIEAAAVQADGAERKLQALEQEERALAEQESMPVEGALAMTRGDLRSLETAADRDRRERQRLLDGIEMVSQEQSSAKENEDRIERDLVSARHRATETTEALRKAVIGLEAAEEAWNTGDESFRAAASKHGSSESRLTALRSVVEGTVNAAARGRASEISTELGSVVELLDVPEQLSAAVDAALGPHQGGFVYEGSVGEIAGGLMGLGLGGISVVASQAIGHRADESIATPQMGGTPLADALGAKGDSELAVRLFGDVLLAEDWATGWAIATAHPALRVVTVQGDLITASAVRLANPDGATPAMVEAAESTLIMASHVLDEAQTDRDRLRSAVEVARQHSAKSETDARLAAGIQDRLLQDLEGVTAKAAAVEGELARLTERVALIDEATEGRSEQLHLLRQRLSALEGEEADRQRAWDELAARRKVVAGRRDLARVERQQREKDVGVLVERRSLMDRRLAEVQREVSSMAQMSFDPDTLERLQTVADQGLAIFESSRDHVATLRVRQAELRASLADQRQVLATSRTSLDELRTAVQQGRDVLNAAEVELAELRVKRESVSEGLRRDADTDEAIALAAPKPEIEEGVDSQDLIRSLEADLRRMGPVNPLAAHEFEELETRRVFMAEQLGDLETSRSEMRAVVAALDNEIEALFSEAFGQIAEAFEENISLLFPGGRGKLTLTDPDNPLTTGVDIKVQPMGKKVSRLSLLSGGERSLAALAFLFGVFKARPSPFYVLDEVEAALDDANLRRFLRLVDTFRGTSQLLIVTHQQQTMEGADVLYGVTMEPGGSSKVISKRITDEQLSLTAS